MRLLLIAAALALATVTNVDAKAGRAGWHSSLINARVLQASPSPSPSVSVAASPSVSSSMASTPSVSSSMASTPSSTSSMTPTPSMTRTAAATASVTAAVSPGLSPSSSNTASVTRSATFTPTRLPSVSASSTPLPTKSAGAAPSSSPRPALTITITQTITTISITQIQVQINTQTAIFTQIFIQIRITMTTTIWRLTVSGARPNVYIKRCIGRVSRTVITFTRESSINTAAVIAGRRLASLWDETGVTNEREALAAAYSEPSIFNELSEAMGRLLQSDANEGVDIEYDVEVPPANVADDGSGDSVRAVQNATAYEVLGALNTATSTGALALAFQPVLNDLATAVGRQPGDLGTSVDTSSAVITFGSASSPAPAGLTGGAIAGIVIGIIAFIAIVALITYFVSRKPKQRVGDAGAPPAPAGGDGAMV